MPGHPDPQAKFAALDESDTRWLHGQIERRTLDDRKGELARSMEGHRVTAAPLCRGNHLHEAAAEVATRPGVNRLDHEVQQMPAGLGIGVSTDKEGDLRLRRGELRRLDGDSVRQV